jgi:hypothetical protein
VFTLKVSVTSAGLELIKADLTRALPQIKSSHRCEAVARSLGFRTYAALRVATQSPDSMIATANGAAFSGYLFEHGFGVLPPPFCRAIGRTAIRDVLERTPKLTLWRIGVGRPQRKADGTWENPQECYLRFVRDREMLLNDHAIEQFLRSLAFLARVQPTKTVRSGKSSYELKHIAENYACTYPEGEQLGPMYVSNGALIAAAIHAGFKYKSCVDDLGYELPNVDFNMPRALLEDLDCEIRPNGDLAQSRRWRSEIRRSKSLYRRYH